MSGNLNNLDEKLERTEEMRGLVRSLPEETVSLQWRSELNERLLMEAAQPKRSWFAWAWRPMAGLAAAAAITAVVMFNAPKPVETSTSDQSVAVVNQLYGAHETAVAYRTLGTPAPISEERPADPMSGYEEVDLGAL